MNIESILQSLPSREDITNAIGLESRSHTSDFASALGIFGTGMLFGAGLALLFAPKTGQQMRRELGEGMQRYGDQARQMAEGSFGSERQMASQGSGQRGQYGQQGQGRQGYEHGAGYEQSEQSRSAQGTEYGRQMSSQHSQGSDAQRTGTNPQAGRQMSGHSTSEQQQSSTSRTGSSGTTGTGSRNV